MESLREKAIAYEPQTTLNIADLPAVPINHVNLIHEEKEDSEGKPYSQNIIVVEGKRYRVPATVLEGIQTIIRIKPDVENVRVLKSGEGKLTKYKVEPLDD